MKLLLTIFISICFCSASLGQADKYKYLDAMLDKNSMIDAITVLNKLKENHQKDTLSAQYWVRYSRASYLLYKYEEAKTSIDKAVKLDPKCAECYYEKGLLHNRVSELEPSLAAMEKAVALEPAGKYYYWKGIVNQQLLRPAEAEKDYDRALAGKFESAELYNNFAILLSEAGNQEKALKMINKAIALNNKYPQAFSARAKVHCLLLNIDSACIDNKTALSMGYYKVFFIPDSVCTASAAKKLQFGADLLAASKFYKQGIEAYSKLIESNVIKSDFFLNRGYCYYHLKEYENAEKDYLKALTLADPATDLIYDNLSLLYYDQNNFQKAIDYSTRRIELDPRNHVPYIDRGLCYRKMKKYKDAEKDFNKSLEIKPDFYRAFGYRSYLFLELGQFNKSYDDASKAVQINPQYGYGYIVLAQAKQKLGIADFCLDLYNAKKYGQDEAEMSIQEYCK